MRFVLLSALVMFAAQAPAETAGRFGVSAALPGGYAMSPAPGNDDGRTYLYPDGAEIRLWGGWLMDRLEQDRADRRGYYRNDGAQITYDTAGPGWYVLSGFLGETIFYLRVEEVRTCGGETALAYLEIRYPDARRSTYDPQIGAIAGSLGVGPC